MLDRIRRGVYRSTPHRSATVSSRHRLSFPFFYDPNFSAIVRPIDMPGGEVSADDQSTRWDKSSVHLFNGTYGDYRLARKVGKVFPGCRSRYCDRDGPCPSCVALDCQVAIEERLVGVNANLRKRRRVLLLVPSPERTALVHGAGPSNVRSIAALEQLRTAMGIYWAMQ